MPNFTAGTSFQDGVTNDVTALKLEALVANAVPTSSLSLNSTTGTISLFSSGTGTAATPAIQPTGDTNTGIFFPAADTIAFSEGGAEAMRIDSSGNVGVGVTSPQQKIDVNGKIRLTPNTSDTNYSADIYASFNSAHPFQIDVKNNGTTAEYFGIYADGGGANNRVVFPTGNVGIGTASPIGKLSVSNGGLNGFEVAPDLISGTVTRLLSYNRSTSAYTDFVFDSFNHIIYTSGIERLRIDSSGNLLVGTTTTPSSTQSGFLVSPTGLLMSVPSANVNIACYKPSGAAQVDYQRFIVGGNTYGAISWNGATGTLYTTTSDYRLKENVQPMQNALATVALLRPVTYRWKNGNTSGQGFIAHELQEVVPDAVSGKKDEVETYKDEDGNNQTRPQYQGIDTSFLVATLTSAIQEQQAIITSLTERITALEAA